MTKLFRPGGPERFSHQRRGLNMMIRTGGVTALLFDPGTGKTAVALDYASILALKSPTGETRVLVVAPLAAVDTWVIQTETFASPEVNYWAEALGGSLHQRAEALASRGGQPFRRNQNDPLASKRALHFRRSLFMGSSDPTALCPDDVPTPRLVIEIVNIDTFSSRRAVGSRTIADVLLDGVKRFEPDMVVVDESHRIKGETSNASRFMSRVTPFVSRRVLLTGTVMPHSPLDVFAQWRFLEPHAFGHQRSDGSRAKATMGQFKHRYAKLGGFMGKEVVGYRNLDEMQRIMSKNAVVARKRDVLDLPRTQDAIVPVNLSAEELKAYTEMASQLATQFADGGVASVPQKVVLAMRLRQLTSGFIPDDSGNVRVLGTSKADTIRSIVHDNLAGEKRIVVFGVFVHELELLEKRLARRGTEVMKISGATPSRERQTIRERFGSDEGTRMVMIAQIKTMSLAVNELVTASNAVFGSPSHQRDDFVQARDRLDRIGQTQPVTFWHAVAPNTIDEVILESHQQRTDLETAVLRHIQNYEKEE